MSNRQFGKLTEELATEIERGLEGTLKQTEFSIECFHLVRWQRHG
jgi:hypothetical protein